MAGCLHHPTGSAHGAGGGEANGCWHSSLQTKLRTVAEQTDPFDDPKGDAAAFGNGCVHVRWQAIHRANAALRSEEHTSELQSLMRSSYAVFCLKKKQSYMNRRVLLLQLIPLARQTTN